MNHILTIAVIAFTAYAAHCQQLSEDLLQLNPPEKFENIHVQKLVSDKNSTSFIIWVRKSVKAHKHETHTENLYVIAGTANMVIGEESRKIKPGDWLIIPQGTVHSVEVTSTKPLKVLSVQAPEFTGKDRIFVD